MTRQFRRICISVSGNLAEGSGRQSGKERARFSEIAFGSLRSILPLILLIACLPGCYEPKDGCIDVNASNYDLDADRPCPDGCCEYPQLRLTFQHKWVYPAASYNLALKDSLYPDANGHLFRLDKISFLLSGFQLHFKDGRTVGISDSLDVETYAADLSRVPAVITDDILLLRPPASTNLSAGSFRSSGQVTGISFMLGLNAPANSAVPESVPDDHPLQDTAQFVDPGQGYYFDKVSLFRTAETTDTTPVALNIAGSGSEIPVFLAIPDEFTLQPGFHLRLTIQVDYSRWFAQIQDIRNDPPEILVQNIVNGLAQSFELKAIVAEVK